MNAISQKPTECLCLVEIIELKWLLSGHGVPLHVERLQAEPEYARATLARAAELPNAVVRKSAERVRECLGHDSA